MKFCLLRGGVARALPVMAIAMLLISSAAMAQPEIDVNPTSLNFGSQRLDAGPTAQLTVQVDNLGDADLTISSVTLLGPASAEFTVLGNPASGPIAASASREIAVTYDPSVVGASAASVEIASDDGDEPTVQVALAGVGTDPEIDVTGGPLAFGDQDIDDGQTVSQSVVITNSGTADLNFTGAGIALVGGGAGEFAITNSPATTPLSAGASREVQVAFDPTALGAAAASLEITTDDADEGTVQVALSGNGTDQEVDVAGGPLAFGSQDVDDGQTATQSVTITNSGTAPLAFTGAGIALVGGDAGEFAITNAPATTPLAAGASREVQVAFDPTAVGAAAASLEITTDDTDEGIVQVALSGTGIDQEIDVTGGPLAFGDQDIDDGQTATQSVTITNTGNTDLTFTGAGIALVGGGAGEFAITNAPATTPLAAGASREVQVAFDPTAVGAAAASLEITTDDNDEPTVQVAISGTGIDQEIDVTGGPIDFGDWSIVGGASAPMSLTVDNLGTAPLTLTTVTLAGASSPDFAIVGNPAASPVAVGASREIQITFDPTTIGAKAASVEIASDDTDEPLVVVGIAGNGTNPPAPEVDVTPLIVDFLTRNIHDGPTPNETVTVSNLGTVDLNLLSLTISGPNSAEFAIDALNSPVTPTVVTAGMSVDVNLNFDPSVRGTRNATLEVGTDDADEPTVSVALTGFGTDRDIAVTPAFIDFGEVDLDSGAAVADPILITNEGDSTLTFNFGQVTLVDSPDPDGFFVVLDTSQPSLPAGATRSVTIGFDPTTLGVHAAAVVIQSNDVDEDSLTVPLLGTGANIPLPAPEIDLSALTVEFPATDLDAAPVMQSFIINNVGNLPLSFTGDGITLAGPDSPEFAIIGEPASPSVIAAGGSREVQIAFDPTTVGAKAASVEVTTDDADEPTLVVAVSGLGYVQSVSVSPLVLEFGAQGVDDGPTSDQSVIITNAGSVSEEIVGATVAGPASADYALLATVSPTTIGAGGSFEIVVSFDPSATGSRIARLEIDRGAANDVTVVLSGQGTDLQTDISVAPAALDFGEWPVNTTFNPKLNVIVANVGDANLSFTGLGLEISGVDAADFTFTAAPDTSDLAPGELRAFVIEFNPSAMAAEAANLAITTNDPDEATVNVPLTGTGGENVGPTGLTTAEVVNDLLGVIEIDSNVNGDAGEDSADVVYNVENIVF